VVAIETALRRLIEDRAVLDRLRRNAYEKAQAYGLIALLNGCLPSSNWDVEVDRWRPYRLNSAHQMIEAFIE
jgi:hypothetical protein